MSQFMYFQLFRFRLRLNMSIIIEISVNFPYFDGEQNTTINAVFNNTSTIGFLWNIQFKQRPELAD